MSTSSVTLALPWWLLGALGLLPGGGNSLPLLSFHLGPVGYTCGNSSWLSSQKHKCGWPETAKNMAIQPQNTNLTMAIQPKTQTMAIQPNKKQGADMAIQPKFQWLSSQNTRANHFLAQPLQGAIQPKLKLDRGVQPKHRSNPVLHFWTTNSCACSMLLPLRVSPWPG